MGYHSHFGGWGHVFDGGHGRVHRGGWSGVHTLEIDQILWSVVSSVVLPFRCLT